MAGDVEGGPVPAIRDQLDEELKILCSTEGRVVYFPVRHHSPASARQVQRAIENLCPSIVLIEGPSSFNSRLSELFLPHKPPIALYCYSGEEDESSRAGWIPFSEYSPEWIALQESYRRAITVQFIDLPATTLLKEGRVDTSPEGTVALLDRFNLPSLSDLWDTALEVPPQMTLAEYLSRAHQLCAVLRMERPASDGDTLRERYMATQLRDALASTEGKVLVVTGGYHSLGLLRLLDEGENGFDEDEVINEMCYLVPYSYRELDALRGYRAGTPNPGFYSLAWRCRTVGDEQPFEAALKELAKLLRKKRQPFSTADMIAAKEMALGLAAVRGLEEPWRREIIEAVKITALKEEVRDDEGHPFIVAVEELFRGGKEGTVAEGATTPPLLPSVYALLRHHGIPMEGHHHSFRLLLTEEEELRKSIILHRLRVLGIDGIRLTSTSRLESQSLEEEWVTSWSPETDRTLIYASRFGATLDKACVNKLALEAKGASFASLTAMILSAAQANLGACQSSLYTAINLALVEENDLEVLSVSLSQLLRMTFSDQFTSSASGNWGRDLCRRVFEKAVSQLLLPGSVPTGSKIEAVISRLLEGASELKGYALSLFTQVLGAVVSAQSHTPLVRGTCLGALARLDRLSDQEVADQILSCGEPEKVGDLLTGLFSLAHRIVHRNQPLLTTLDTLITGFSTEGFIAALPSLRLAFSYLLPRDKAELSRELTSSNVTKEMTPSVEGYSFETRLFETMKRLGIRGASGGE